MPHRIAARRERHLPRALCQPRQRRSGLAPRPNIELLAAATGPRTLRLSGELTTGTVITGRTTPDALRAAVEHIRAGLARRAEPQPHSVITYLLCAAAPNARQDTVNEIQHWGLNPATDAAAYGTADEIATAAQRWVDAGADTIDLQPTAGTHIETFARFVGAEVQPLIQRSA